MTADIIRKAAGSGEEIAPGRSPPGFQGRVDDLARLCRSCGGRPVVSGHFIPEDAPEETLARFRAFFVRRPPTAPEKYRQQE
ncbi:MAG: hypothetical protein LBS49_04260 [Candidatus Accumulibacter sp.]|jgi:hypothetical protein|nr:hypothetical protein [Accumulibacter sp.]